MTSVAKRHASVRLVRSLAALTLATTLLGANAGAQRLSARSPRPNEPSAEDIQRVVDQAYARFKGLKEGKNADYIPALAKVDPNIFGIALVTTDGKVYTAGDIKSEVSIQSISKVFTMAKVMEEQGPEAIEKTIGVDATGMVLSLEALRYYAL